MRPERVTARVVRVTIYLREQDIKTARQVARRGGLRYQQVVRAWVADRAQQVFRP